MSDKELYTIITIGLILLAVAACIVIGILKRKAAALEMDEMEGHEFEYFCAEILREADFEDVEVTRGSGDFGVDILASKDGISYAFQCKCYDRPIGVKAVQEVYAGRDYYDRMVGVVMSNQYFTEPAAALAAKLKIVLWDRDRLRQLSGDEV